MHRELDLDHRISNVDSVCLGAIRRAEIPEPASIHPAACVGIALGGGAVMWALFIYLVGVNF